MVVGDRVAIFVDHSFAFLNVIVTEHYAEPATVDAGARFDGEVICNFLRAFRRVPEKVLTYL